MNLKVWFLVGLSCIGSMAWSTDFVPTVASDPYGLYVVRGPQNSISIHACRHQLCKEISTFDIDVINGHRPGLRKVGAVTLGTAETIVIGVMSAQLVSGMILSDFAGIIIWGGSQYGVTRVDHLNPVSHWKRANVVSLLQDSLRLNTPVAYIKVLSFERLLELIELVGQL